MSAAAWGAIGTVVGGGLTLLGTVLTTRLQQRQARAADDAQRTEELRRERKDAYLRLLAVVRRLRFVARGEGFREGVDELQLRSELSSVSYEIDLIAPAEVSGLAAELAEATRGYLRSAAAGQAARTMSAGEHPEGQRVQVRALVDRFIEAARADLG